MKPGTPARIAAATIVQRVIEDGGYSNVLTAEARADLPRRDAAHMQRSAMSAIRFQRPIDGLLGELSRRPLDSLDPAVRNVLRVGVAELLVDGVDPHGAVDGAVDAARELGAMRATGFVNACLRRIGRDRLKLTESSFEPWIRTRLAAQWGEADADAFLSSADLAAPRGVRVRRPPVQFEPVPGVPNAGYLATDDPEPEPGAVDYIDPASTAVAAAAEVEPGMRVLDMAAAPGGKTAALADALEGTGRLVAADVHERRLTTTRRRLRRMGLDATFVVADGRRPPFAPASFDVVLLDAPCTGLGSVRRRPEIRHHLDPTTPAQLAGLQRDLVAAAQRLVAPGGRLVYSVCTVFAEETVEIVDGIGRPPELEVGRVWGSGRLLAPHLDGTDGMFISVVER